MVKVKRAMCKFADYDPSTDLRHVIRRHKNNPSFAVQCQFEGCGSTYLKWRSFKQHLRRNHAGQVLEALLQDNGPRIPIQDALRVQGENLLHEGNLPDAENQSHDGNLMDMDENGQ